MIKKGSKVKFTGSFSEATFHSDEAYYKGVFDVLGTFKDGNRHEICVIGSYYNNRRNEHHLGLHDERFWKLDLTNFVEIPFSDLFDDELDQLFEII